MSCGKFAGTHIRNNRSKAFIIAATLAAFVSASAQTRPQHDPPAQPSTAESDLINPDRPGIDDCSTVIGAKRFQIESGVQEEFRRSGNEREHTFFVPTLLRFGIDSNWEVRIEGNSFTRVVTFDSTNTAIHTSGFAPTSIGFKYHIYNSTGAHQISLGTIVRVFPPWGSKEFRTQHTTGDIRLAADWNFAPGRKLSLNPNIGVGRYEDDKGRLFTAGLFALVLVYVPAVKDDPRQVLSWQGREAEHRKAAGVDER